MILISYLYQQKYYLSLYLDFKYFIYQIVE